MAARQSLPGRHLLIKSDKLKELTWTSLFIALVAIATMVIQVPTVATAGFINVGDTMILVAALMISPRTGLIAGG